MVKASSRIEQELALLQQQTEAMSDALEPLYEGYLKALSEAVKRQLVLAAYHLCTQAYPDKFLVLSWEQRNQLQQSLQILAGQIYPQLQLQYEQAKKTSRQPQQHNGLAFLQRLLEARSTGNAMLIKSANQANTRMGGTDDNQAKEDRKEESLGHNSLSSEDFEPIDFDHQGLESRSSEQHGSDQHGSDQHGSERYDLEGDGLEGDGLEGDDLEGDGLEGDGWDRRDGAHGDELDFEMDVPAADQRLTMDEEDDLLAALEGLARRSLEGYGRQSQRTETAAEEVEKPLAPIHLVKQQVLLEKSIQDVFATVSEEANALLQKAQVMPSFPKALLAAATDSQGIGDPANAVPNVVKVSVRVMQGEALLEDDALAAGELDSPLGDDEFNLDDGVADPDSGDLGASKAADDVNLRRRSQRDRNFNRLDRRSPSPDSHGEISGGKFPRDDRLGRMPRSSHSPVRRIVSREIMEIDALPELAAISLRLSEVEFTDPTVSAWRSRLRQKLNELKKLGVRYKKTQRALETAQAEDAWRSSWTVRHDDDRP